MNREQAEKLLEIVEEMIAVEHYSSSSKTLRAMKEQWLDTFKKTPPVKPEKWRECED